MSHDEPAHCIRHFVRLLRDCAAATEHAELDVRLVGFSARAQTTIRDFAPNRTKGVAFPLALDVAEELTQLGLAKIKSLSFFLSARGFRWKGSQEGSTADLVLSDTKISSRKRRFHLSAHLKFDAADSEAPAVDRMLEDIASATGIRFAKDASTIRVGADEAGRATAEELLATVLTWREIIHTVGQTVRRSIDLRDFPHLVTRSKARAMVADRVTPGPRVKVDFSRAARRCLKREFPEFSWVDGEFGKAIAEDLRLTLRLDWTTRTSSREFTAAVGIALASPRFAPAPHQPWLLSVNLLALFGIESLSMVWAYSTEADLAGSLTECTRILKRVLPIVEAAAVRLRGAERPSMQAFEGPRELTARQAFDLALPSARAWSDDAALIGIGLTSLAAQYVSHFEFSLTAAGEEGRLSMDGAWRITFYSGKKQESLSVEVPWRGPIAESRRDAPLGREWPSENDQILSDGWRDSVDAVSIARIKLRESGKPEDWWDAGGMALSSQANASAVGIPAAPLRDGMFAMEAAWQITFSRGSGRTRTTAVVKVPAYGEAPATLEMNGNGGSGVQN